MSKPLVSIILPVYNAQNHIARCLESICAQSWQNIEVIVLNDGSKDQSLPVCEAFRAKDERIVLVDKANSGVSDTRNLGLKLASGKYVQFVDSDDYIDPDFTEHLVTAAEQNNADLVIAPYKMVIPAGATKPEQVLDKLQDELGVMTVARPLQGGHRRGQGLLEGCPRGRADPHRRSARALERHAGGAAGNGAGTQCRVEGPARQRPQRISKNNKREAAGACTLRHGFPLFYAMFSGRVLSSRWRRTSWPATRAPRRSGGVPASRTPDGGSCSASPVRPWSAHRARWEKWRWART